MLLGGTGAALLGFTVPPRAPVTEASSHLPWVNEQEVPQPSQVLFHLKMKPPGQGTTCKWSLKTIYLLLYETKTVQKRFKCTLKNNSCSCKEGQPNFQLWLNSAGAEEFSPPHSRVICESTRLIFLSWGGHARMHQES